VVASPQVSPGRIVSGRIVSGRIGMGSSRVPSSVRKRIACSIGLTGEGQLSYA
jgi:hypothetical protein